MYFLQNLIKYEMSIIPRFLGDIVFLVRFIHIALQENWIFITHFAWTNVHIFTYNIWSF